MQCQRPGASWTTFVASLAAMCPLPGATAKRLGNVCRSEGGALGEIAAEGRQLLGAKAGASIPQTRRLDGLAI